MRVLWVFAHPEPKLLNAGLRDEGWRALTEAGHETALSDLYAMGWKAILDRDDFAFDACLPSDRIGLGHESKRAHLGHPPGTSDTHRGPRTPHTLSAVPISCSRSPQHSATSPRHPVRQITDSGLWDRWRLVGGQWPDNLPATEYEDRRCQHPERCLTKR